MAVNETPLSSGVTEKTPESILLGAGTIHKGLKYTASTGWNFKETLIGATSGGSKLAITPEVVNVEIDGANVKVEGLAAKQGETATLETNFAELTPEIMKWAVIGSLGDASGEMATGYTEIKSKPRIEKGDYIEHLAYVGKTLKDGKPIIIIFDKALCTSGMELEGKAKEAAVSKITFECYAEITGDLETLPYHIYFPKAAAAAASKTKTK